MPCAGLEEVNLLFDWLSPLFCGGCKSGRSSIRPAFGCQFSDQNFPIMKPNAKRAAPMYAPYNLALWESMTELSPFSPAAIKEMPIKIKKRAKRDLIIA
jgi:hypothetical protein